MADIEIGMSVVDAEAPEDADSIDPETADIFAKAGGHRNTTCRSERPISSGRAAVKTVTF